MAWFVPQAMAGGAPQDVQAVPSGNGIGTVLILDDGAVVAGCSYNGVVTNPNPCAADPVSSGSLIRVQAYPLAGGATTVTFSQCPTTPIPISGGLECVFTAISIGPPAPGQAVLPQQVKMTFTSAATLTVQKTGNGQGSVQSAPAGISNCTTTCTAPFNNGTSVTLVATPAPGSVFTGFTGCTASPATPNQCTFTINGNRTVTANFSVVFTLSVTLAGSGQGTVVSSPPGINCGVPGGSCSASVSQGTSVSLTATAASGSNFIGFTGCPSVNGNVCTVNVAGATNVTATFQPSEVQASVIGNKTRCTGPRPARRQLKITIDTAQAITVVVRLRNNRGVTVQRKRVVEGTPDTFQITMNIGNGKKNGKYTAQITMTNQFGTQKVETRNVKLKTC